MLCFYVIAGKGGAFQMFITKLPFQYLTQTKFSRVKLRCEKSMKILFLTSVKRENMRAVNYANLNITLCNQIK